MQLNSARNLKTEIRLEVTAAIERLYQLVKEAEADSAAGGKARGTEEQTARRVVKAAVVPKETTEVESVGSTAVMELLAGNNALLKENARKIEEIRAAMEDQKGNDKRIEELREAVVLQTETFERATYASVAAAGKTKEESPDPAALHSVVVSSRDDFETGDVVLEKIRKVMNAKEGWVKVERVRKGKDRKVIMGCRTQEERNKVKRRIEEEGDGLVVEVVKNKDPLLVLKGVLLIHSNEEVLAALQNQNRGVFDGLKDEDIRMSVKYKKKTRNPNTTHYVLSVSPGVWKRAIDARHLHVDLQRVPVEDQSPLIQCTCCLGYGHTKRYCLEPSDLCSSCGEKHLQKDCPNKDSPELERCVNCTRAKLPHPQHNAFSNACPIRKKWEAMARVTVAYH